MNAQGNQLDRTTIDTTLCLVHYQINKLPVPEWGMELSQLQPQEVKEFQAWCLWARDWKQTHGEWGRILKACSQTYPGLGVE